jgi:hypothetical protein
LNPLYIINDFEQKAWDAEIKLTTFMP